MADDLIVSLSRVVAQDVNIFDGPNSSPERTQPIRVGSAAEPDSRRSLPCDLHRRPALVYVGRERAGGLDILFAATPVLSRAARHAHHPARVATTGDAGANRGTRSPACCWRRCCSSCWAPAWATTWPSASPIPSIGLIRAYPPHRARRLRRPRASRPRPTNCGGWSMPYQMADDLQRQRSELERTNRLAAWADMAGQVAHDIKNPLTPIQLNAEHLRRVHLDQTPAWQRHRRVRGNILGQVRLLRRSRQSSRASRRRLSRGRSIPTSSTLSRKWSSRIDWDWRAAWRSKRTCRRTCPT